jgi:hypothetical protein
MADPVTYLEPDPGQAKVKANLREANKHEFRAEFTFHGHVKWHSGMCFALDQSYGNFAGKYLIERTRHRFVPGEGYTTQVEAHKCLVGY